MKMILQIEAEDKQIPDLIREIAAMKFTVPIVFNMVSQGGEKVAMPLGKQAEVPEAQTTYGRSWTTIGKWYTVTKHTDGNYSCDCPAWKHNVTRPCKHIFAARTNHYQIWEDKMKDEPQVLTGPSWFVMSQSYKKPGKFYEVKGVGTTAVSCTCPDHIHRGHKCKHMAQVEKEMAAK